MRLDYGYLLGNLRRLAYNLPLCAFASLLSLGTLIIGSYDISWWRGGVRGRSVLLKDGNVICCIPLETPGGLPSASLARFNLVQVF